MGLIKAILNLVILVLLGIFGYWLYASFVSAPNARYWTEINRNMPDPLRRFSCDEVRKREPAAPLQSCEGY
jgi:hypothetical protein